MSDSFQNLTKEYDVWFDQNPNLYATEVEAVKQFVPENVSSVEIGVGTGRFSAALGIPEGVEPCAEMAEVARQRGIQVYEGCAEKLPLKTGAYDVAVMVTVDCFLSDIKAAFCEIARVLKENGAVVVAFLNRETELGQMYEQMKASNPFYKDAHFHSADEIKNFLQEAGFTISGEVQTVFSLEDEKQEVKKGSGEGVFTVVKATK